MIDHEAVALTLLCIRAEADSDVHAREAMARYFVSQVGEEGTGDDQLSLGGWQEEEQGWDWPEWLASDQHPIGKPFQGPSGRWFVRKDVGDGKSRVVPAPNPDKAKAAPKEKAAAKPQNKPTPAKRAPAVPKTKVSVEETWAKVQDALKGGGSAEDAVQALAGLGLADIRKLRDQHKGEKGGRSKSEVAQRLIAAVKSRMEGQQAPKAKESPAKPEPKPMPAPAAKPEVTTDTIRQAWDKLPGAKDNLVSLADLQDALGVDTPTLHRLVNDLRRKGVLTAQNLEGRTGTQAEKDRLKAAGIPDGQNTIGYVAMMDAGQGQAPAPVPASKTTTPYKPRTVKEHPPETIRTDLTPNERTVVDYWSAVGYERANMFARGQEAMTPEAQRFINVLSGAIRKTKPMSEPILVKRGMGMTPEDAASFIASVESAMQSGGMMRLPGFTSTTTGMAEGRDTFSQLPVQMNIGVRQGMSIEPFTKVKGENEILLDHNSTFRIRGVRKQGKQYIIDMEQVLDEEDPT